MPRLKGSRTEEHLRAAFVREAQDNRRFEYFARLAALEGHVALARALRQIAEGETAHALGHLEFLEAIEQRATASGFDDVRAHLERAIAEEQHRCERYPAYAAAAREERLAEVAEWFDMLAGAKRAHLASLTGAREQLEELR